MTIVMDEWYIVGACIGSILMWIFIGRPLVMKYSGKGVERWIKKAVDDPEGEQSTLVGRLAGLFVAHILTNMADLVPENVNEPAHPGINLLMRRLELHTANALLLAFNRQGSKFDAATNAGDPTAALPAIFGEKAGGMDGLAQMMSLMKTFGGQGEGTGGDEVSTQGQIQGW